jgi:hypothetical protein
MSSPYANSAPIPREIDRWNWGAFLLSWIWGIGNNTFIALLALVPFVNLVMIFVLGAKGSAWAWRNKQWDSVEHFRRVQRRWAIAGVVFWIALVGLMVALYFAISAAFKSSDVYQQAMAKVSANAEALEILGPPLTGGFPMGSIHVSGPSGTAQMSIPVRGTKARGTIFVEATKAMGEWSFDHIQLEIEGRDARIDLESGKKVLPHSRGGQQVSLEAAPIA